MVRAGSAAGRVGGLGGEQWEREGVPWGVLRGPKGDLQQVLDVPLRGQARRPELESLAAAL